MIIHPAHITVADGRCRMAAMVEIETPDVVFSAVDSSKQELWIDWPAEYFVPEAPDGGPFLLICLTVAMCLNERLVSNTSVSQCLLINVLEAIEIYKNDFPDLCEVISVETQTHQNERSVKKRVGSFYSGGVDSLYNIAEHLRLNDLYGVKNVSDLWLIQGMDIKLNDDALWSKTKFLLESQISEYKQLRYVDVRTNARAIHDSFVGWEELGFSAILGGIAKCFSPIINTVLIGSYGKYKDILPHSSSPLVDPMWSCDQQNVRHFSCRANRLEKIQTIAKFAPDLLKNLRVCYLNPEGSYNCGRCEKCLRTQMQLMLAGCLDKCDTFDNELTPNSLNKLKLPWARKNKYTWDFWNDIRAACQDAGYDAFEKQIRKELRRNKFIKMRKRAKMYLLRKP